MANRTESLVRPTHPCGRHCENRSVGCRSTCEAWKDYETAQAAYYAEKAKLRDFKDAIYGATPAYRRAMRKKQHDHKFEKRASEYR